MPIGGETKVRSFDKKRTEGRRLVLKSASIAATAALFVVWFALAAQSYRWEALVRTPQEDIDRISRILNNFKVEFGRYPTQKEGLKALIEDPNVSGRYFDTKDWLVKDSSLVDQWGHEYRYAYPGVHGPAPFDIYSAGPDGILDTPDDIKSWDIAGLKREYPSDVHGRAHLPGEFTLLVCLVLSLVAMVVILVKC